MSTSLLKLKQLQQEFTSALESDSSLETLAPQLYGLTPLDPKKRFQIYRGFVQGALIKALTQTYVVCRKLVGEEYFFQLARLYCDLHPSQSQDLNGYGADFPNFIQELVKEKEEAAELIYLSDVAILEWHLYRSYYTPDDAPFDFALFSQVKDEDQENIVFKLAASASLIKSRYPIDQIWKENIKNGEPGFIDLNKGGVQLLIWRKDYQPQLEMLDDISWKLLCFIQGEYPLRELAQFFQVAEEGVNVSTLIPEFIKRGWIVGFSILK